MEDAYTVYRGLALAPDKYAAPCAQVFAIFDGHGGSHVAQYCALHLVQHLEQALAWEASARDALKRTFGALEMGAIRDLPEGIIATCGTTALVVVQIGRETTVAHCGDSRAVLSRAPHTVTVDHKPQRVDERARIEAEGGFVMYMPRQNYYLTMGTLAMSRAIGDIDLHPWVSSEPEITEINADHDNDFLLLASDGLWDVMTNEDAVSCVETCLAEKTENDYKTDRASQFASALRVLVGSAYTAGSRDNISAIIIDMQNSR
jgi:serine/threonine protein phosphatase PrpC